MFILLRVQKPISAPQECAYVLPLYLYSGRTEALSCEGVRQDNEFVTTDESGRTLQICNRKLTFIYCNFFNSFLILVIKLFIVNYIKFQ